MGVKALDEKVVEHQQNRTLVPEGTRWYAEVRDGTRSLNAISGTFTQNSKPPWYAMVRDGTRWYARILAGGLTCDLTGKLG